MDWTTFFIGIGLLLIALLLYLWNKGSQAVSEEKDRGGMVLSAIIQYWFAIIACTLFGIILLLKSLF